MLAWVRDSTEEPAVEMNTGAPPFFRARHENLARVLG
jgi:hypothetical protein